MIDIIQFFLISISQKNEKLIKYLLFLIMLLVIFFLGWCGAARGGGIIIALCHFWVGIRFWTHQFLKSFKQNLILERKIGWAKGKKEKKRDFCFVCVYEFVWFLFLLLGGGGLVLFSIIVNNLNWIFFLVILFFIIIFWRQYFRRN